MAKHANYLLVSAKTREDDGYQCTAAYWCLCLSVCESLFYNVISFGGRALPAPVAEFGRWHRTVMEKRVHLILSFWIASHVCHAILSLFYEQMPMVVLVPVIYASFILLAVRAWRRHRRAARMCAMLSIVTIAIQIVFISKREAYGSLSIPVLVFDILGAAASLAYLVFYFSSARERYLAEPNAV